MAKPRPEFQFRIYPFDTKLYLKVSVFKTLGDLRAYATGLLGCLKSDNRDTLAMMVGEFSFTGKFLNPLLGEILFCKKNLDWDTIIHELTHALFRIIERRGWKTQVFARPKESAPASDREEQICYAAGRMARQVEAKLKKFNLP